VLFCRSPRKTRAPLSGDASIVEAQRESLPCQQPIFFTHSFPRASHPFMNEYLLTLGEAALYPYVIMFLYCHYNIMNCCIRQDILNQKNNFVIYCQN